MKVRVVSPWPKRIQIDSCLFDTDIKHEEADALLSYWAPSEELFSFNGPKAWYCCEPECQFNAMDQGRWVEIKARLAENEFLNHNHPDPFCRVPHITHFGEIEVNRNGDRKDRAIAVVSNFGGGPRKRHPQIHYRNRFITDPLVDLYGRPSWRKYRKSLFSFPGIPKNYKGEIPGDWPATEKRALLAQYKVCICLENMTEPNYFTEKLVEAVAAGCIPVYHAHASLADTVLEGAMWVDPADYGDDPRRAIEAALDSDLLTLQSNNSSWLKSPLINETSHQAVFKKIAKILTAAD